ncbi:MAG: HK97 family phage prohead protease [Alphaproteobacteria bacterium]|nr:HK97 family phage prohead protease [Alphaproteobacteria bacterium]
MQKLYRPFSMKTVESSGTFSGYASVWNTWDAQEEQVLPGAFSTSLQRSKDASSWPKLLWQHDPQEPIGAWDEIQEDSHGLFVQGTLFLELQKAKEAHLLLQKKVVDGLSIGYVPQKVKHTQEGRLLEVVDLHEISLVTFPSNPSARIHAVKKKEIVFEPMEDVEDLYSFQQEVGLFIHEIQSYTYH